MVSFFTMDWQKLLFPENIYCLSCGTPIRRSRTYSLCDTCVRRFGWVEEHTCAKCGKVLPEGWTQLLCHDCRQGEHIFDRGYTCASYGLHERMLISALKERGESHIGRQIGEIMYDRLQVENSAPFGEGHHVPYTATVPVPASQDQYLRRGYNQSALIARALARRLQRPCWEVLKRTRQTARMRDLGPEERRRNVAGIFVVRPGTEKKLEGASLLLVDDVYTTGSTADGCARALKAAGADRVDVITFAAGGNYIPDRRQPPAR